MHLIPNLQMANRQQALAKALGTDLKGIDLPRTLRIPGFYHQKSEPFLTRLIDNS
jgi:hypothetical protein